VAGNVAGEGAGVEAIGSRKLDGGAGGISVEW